MASPLNTAAMDADRAMFRDSLLGAEVGRMLSLASFCLIIYEYMLTLDAEMNYFWRGRWTPSRVLFLVNRYLPPIVIMLNVIGYCMPEPSLAFCAHGIPATFFLSLLSIAFIQGILTLRIWYLFEGGPIVRISVIAAFATSVMSSFVLLYLSFRELRIIPAERLVALFPAFRNVGCKAARPDHYWRVFVPGLLLHTLLYILTAVRAVRNRRMLKNSPVLKRLLRDGGFFYFVVFASVGLTSTGSFVSSDPKINIPAIYSPFLLTTTSIAVSRIMFSIHSLADRLGSDSAWLLTHLQLSRVGWRPGAHEGEIIVDRNSAYEDDDLGSKDSHSMKDIMGSVVKTTRVGTYDEPWYGRPAWGLP